MKKVIPKSVAKNKTFSTPSQAELNKLIELFNQNKNEELERLARALLVKFPKQGFIWKVFGSVLQRLGRLEESLEAKNKAAQLLPQDPEAAYNLGNALNEFKRFAEAEICYRRALKLNANFKKANYNLGLVLQHQHRYTEAVESYQREIVINPNYAEAHNNLGNMLKNLGHLDKAELSYRQALVVDPRYIDAYTNLLYTLAHNPDALPEFAFQEALNFGVAASLGIQPLIHANGNRNSTKKLRIGMVSGDFFNHAVAYFIEPLLACLDKTHFELVAYYNNTQNDSFTQKIKTYFTGWRDVAALTDIQLAQQIANDQIDIAIDLSGHTDKNRLLSFAYKPAPIQVSWLGYPATTGLKAMDYYLVDSDWSPEGLLDAYFIEKLVYLPSVVTFAASDDSPPVVDTPALKKGYITFGSFNRTSKLTQKTLDLWCQVLTEIPSAKMILGNVSDESLQRQLENEFLHRGISPERLTFYAKKTILEYLALHGEVDFILDTFPYAGGTTTGFALWMGVPVLTYAWKSLAGRGGVVMLSRVELHHDFTAHSPDQFIDMAKYWSSNIETLQTLRHQLRDRMKNSTKSKPENVARGLEKGLRMMWERFCVGQAIESFTV